MNSSIYSGLNPTPLVPIKNNPEKPSKEIVVKNNLCISVLFEHEDFLVVAKPAGLVIHSDGKTVEETLCDSLAKEYPELKGVGEPARLPDGTFVDRPGVVHRLDRDTSGVMLIARNQKSFEYFKKQFQDRRISKIYNVIVWGFVKEEKGVIERPIGRSKSDFRKWSAERFARGELRDAVTEYKVIARYDEGNHNPKVQSIKQVFTFIEAYPKTGRTHQIRVHFKAINHPVVGDTLYAPNHPQALGLSRMALHARFVSFVTADGQPFRFEASLPEDFQKAVSTCFTI
jgi:23S rRNA pseudouridine1911/1915/1917 synthase